MRKGQGYDCTPGLFLPFVTYEPFSAVFDTRQEECLKDMRCLLADHLRTAPYLLQSVFPLVQLPREVTGCFMWVVCGNRFWYLRIKIHQKMGVGNSAALGQPPHLLGLCVSLGTEVITALESLGIWVSFFVN